MKIDITDAQRVKAADFDRAAVILTTLRPIAARQDGRRELIQQAANELRLSERTVYRCLQILTDGDDKSVRAFIRKKRGPQRGTSRLDAKTEAIVDGAIKRAFLCREKANRSRVHALVKADCYEAGIRAPSSKAIRHRIKRISRALVMQKQAGKKKADTVFAPVPGTYSIDAAYSVVQIDHTECDVVVLDEAHRQPVGRPWITLAIDVASRMIAGYYISLDPPSLLATGTCLTRAICPKDKLIASLSFDFPWPCSGIPDLIHSDSGADFESSGLKRALRAYDIDHAFRPTATPRYGGHIERLIGTMMGAMHFLPGTTFGSVAERRARDYDSEGKARLTVDELEQWTCAQINIYHNTTHSVLGMPPILKWDEAIAARLTPVRSVEDYDQLAVDFLPFEYRKLTRTGIRLNNIRYWHASLSSLVGAIEAKLAIHFDPRDLGAIFVSLPRGGFVVAKYADQRRPAVSLSEVRAAKIALRAKIKGELHEEQIFQMIRRQREIISRATAETRKVRKAAVQTKEKARHRASTSVPSRILNSAVIQDRTPVAGGDDFDVPDLKSILEIEDW